MIRLLAVLLLTLATTVPAWAAPDHRIWDTLLRKHVLTVRGGQSTLVDYAGMKADAPQLARYLAQLSAVTASQFARWERAEQLAFLINAYNAATVQLVAAADPQPVSIQDLGTLFRSPWKNPLIRLLDQTRSLDDIEHGLIRGSGRSPDPRIHFAVNCASIGCPALRAEAFVPGRLEAQLEQQARFFLADRSRNRLDAGMLRVSRIFKWYRADFESGWRGARTLGAFLALYADALGIDAGTAARGAAGQLDIEFLDYDWGLNALAGKRP